MTRTGKDPVKGEEENSPTRHTQGKVPSNGSSQPNQARPHQAPTGPQYIASGLPSTRRQNGQLAPAPLGRGNQARATSSMAPAPAPAPNATAPITQKTVNGSASSENPKKRKASSSTPLATGRNGAKGPKTSSKKRVAGNIQKHTPYTPPGTIFKWKDNKHIPTTNPCILGVQGRRRDMTLPMVDTNGNNFTYRWPHRNQMDWNDKKHIAGVHKWRKQLIDRRLGAIDLTIPKTTRPHWTEREQASIQSLMKVRYEEKGDLLLLKDFEEITEEHNRTFEGVEIRIGERTPSGLNSNGKMSKGSIVKIAHVLGRRTAYAVYSQAQRWKGGIEYVSSQGARSGNANAGREPSVDPVLPAENLPASEIENDYTEGYLDKNVPGDMDNTLYHSDTSEEGDAGEEDDEEEDEDVKPLHGHGGDFDAHLEDSSDDEDEGRRPASNQTGARLIPA